MNRHTLALFALGTVLCGGRVAAAQQVVLLPAVTGPIPVTAESYPLMTSNKLQAIVDLPKAGYVEEEFFISGRVNVYDWAPDGTVIL